jgi:hypothetical protein
MKMDAVLNHCSHRAEGIWTLVTVKTTFYGTVKKEIQPYHTKVIILVWCKKRKTLRNGCNIRTIERA